jgi:hypothetical protein
MNVQYHEMGTAFYWVGFLLMAAVGSGALLLGLLVLLQAAAPDLLGRANASLRKRPVVSLALGAALTAAFMALASLGKSLPPAGAFSVAAFGALALFGLAAAAENLGRRVAWISGREGSRLSNLAIGWLVFFGAACVPYVGWFLVLPWGVASGLGGLALGASRPSAAPSSDSG